MLYNGDSFIDDRGKISFVNDFDFYGVRRFYIVENHKAGYVRAWHGHKKEDKWFYVVSGAALVGAMSMNADAAEKPTRLVLSAEKPQILLIPHGNYNGFKLLTNDTKIIILSSATLHDSLNDDHRLPYDTWDIWKVEPR